MTVKNRQKQVNKHTTQAAQNVRFKSKHLKLKNIGRLA